MFITTDIHDAIDGNGSLVFDQNARRGYFYSDVNREIARITSTEDVDDATRQQFIRTFNACICHEVGRSARRARSRTLTHSPVHFAAYRAQWGGLPGVRATRQTMETVMRTVLGSVCACASFVGLHERLTSKNDDTAKLVAHRHFRRLTRALLVVYAACRCGRDARATRDAHVLSSDTLAYGAEAGNVEQRRQAKNRRLQRSQQQRHHSERPPVARARAHQIKIITPPKKSPQVKQTEIDSARSALTRDNDDDASRKATAPKSASRIDIAAFARRVAADSATASQTAALLSHVFDTDAIAGTFTQDRVCRLLATTRALLSDAVESTRVARAPVARRLARRYDNVASNAAGDDDIGTAADAIFG